MTQSQASALSSGPASCYLLGIAKYQFLFVAFSMQPLRKRHVLIPNVPEIRNTKKEAMPPKWMLFCKLCFGVLFYILVGCVCVLLESFRVSLYFDMFQDAAYDKAAKCFPFWRIVGVFPL